MSSALSELLLRADPPMVVVTVAPRTNGDGRAYAADGPSGCLVGFWSQCSIEPERVAVWLSTANHTFDVARPGSAVAVHLVGRSQKDKARWFAETTGDEVDTFDAVAWSPGLDDVPLIDGLPDRVVGRIVQMRDGLGDHVCVVIEPVGVQLAPEPDDAWLRLREASAFHAAHPA